MDFIPLLQLREGLGQDESKTYHEPFDNVRVCRASRAAGLDLISGRLDDNWVFKSTCKHENVSMDPEITCILDVGSSCEGSIDPFPPIHVPTLSDGSGDISKISIPCIFPRISRRSRPVTCSRSVGTVPGSAPGGRRSFSDLISV